MPVQYKYCFICAWESIASNGQWKFDGNVFTDLTKARLRAAFLANSAPGMEVHLLRTTQVFFVEPTTKKPVAQSITVPEPE